MARWQGRLEFKQCFQGRVVDIGAELFAMSAAVVRAEMLRAGGTNGAEAYELADMFCRQSRLRVARLFDALWTNTDAADTRLSKGVLKDRYTWLEEGIIDPAPDGLWISSSAPGASQRPNVARRILGGP